MVVFLSWLVLLIFGCDISQNYSDERWLFNTSNGYPYFTPVLQEQLPRTNNGDIEDRLTRLNISLVEKLENLKTEILESNLRFRALELELKQSYFTIEKLFENFNRFPQQTAFVPAASVQQSNSVLENSVDKLSKEVQILMVATRGLTSVVNVLKTNVSSLVNDTRAVLRSTSNFVTKQFFNNGLLELKHQELYRSFPQYPLCPAPSAPDPVWPKNCREIVVSGATKSGIFRIQPEHSSKDFMVVCDFETVGGGWTVIQNRFEGSQDFYQNWHEYKHGFGNLGGEFWLGLENIYQLTGYEVNELLIQVRDMKLQNKTAQYAEFSIGPEVEGFPLKVLGGYSGDAGDSLLYHAGSRFSTKDMDQDSWLEGSCAQAHGGAWWYRSCDMSNLNGRYLSGELPNEHIHQGMYWGEFQGAKYNLLWTRMLVRPRNHTTPVLLDDVLNTKNTAVPKAESGINPL